MVLEGADVENFNFPYTQFDFSHLNVQNDYRRVFIFLCMHLLI